MKKLDKNVLGSQKGGMSEALETQFENHKKQISTAVEAEVNCNSLEPNHYSRKQKFAMQVLILSAALLAVNTDVFAEPSCNSDQLTGSCPSTGTTGPAGASAYEIATDPETGNFTGTVEEWLASLKGDPGDDGKSAYEIATDPETGNFTGTVQEWLDSLKGDDGFSAYQIAVETLSFTPDSTQTEAQNILAWLKSLKGTDGTNGITPEVMAAADTVTLSEAKTYVDQVGQQTLNDAKAYTDSRVNALNQDMRKLEDKTYAAVASSIAIASLPQPTEPGMSMVSAGVGTWEGEQGYAFGLSGVTENNKYVYKVAITGNSESDFGAGASIGYQWK